MGDVAVSPPISPPHNNNHKRVSFGENNVKTFIYEKETIPREEPPPSKQPFTDPSAPATRVRVVAENSSEIRPIAPPTEIEEDTRRPTSPPLRSYKMEEHENPFKPQEQLYHEVDPIVEQYLHKPFPPSHPGSANTTPVKQPYSRESPAYYQNGLSINDIGFEQEKKQRESQPLVDQGRPDHYSHKNPNGNEELPPANTVEMVHIKKKKCGCCSLQ